MQYQVAKPRKQRALGFPKFQKTNLTVSTAETSVEVDKVLAEWSFSIWQPALCLQRYALLRAEESDHFQSCHWIFQEDEFGDQAEQVDGNFEFMLVPDRLLSRAHALWFPLIDGIALSL